MEAIEGTWFLDAPFDVVEAALIKALRFDICVHYKHDRIADGYSHFYSFGYGTTSWHEQFVTAIWVRKIKAGTEIEIQGPPKPSMVLPLDEQGNPILLPEIEQDSEGLGDADGAELLTPDQRTYLIRLGRINRSKVPDPKDEQRYEAAVGLQEWLLTRVIGVFNQDLAAQDAHARLQWQKAEDNAPSETQSPTSREDMVLARLDEWGYTLTGKLDDVNRLQRTINEQIGVESRATVNLILTEMREQSMSQGEMQATLDAVRRVLQYILKNGLSVDLPALRQLVTEIYQQMNVNMTLKQQLELSLPVIPLLLDYKVVLEPGVDLGELWNEIQERFKRNKSTRQHM